MVLDREIEYFHLEISWNFSDVQAKTLTVLYSSPRFFRSLFFTIRDHCHFQTCYMQTAGNKSLDYQTQKRTRVSRHLYHYINPLQKKKKYTLFYESFIWKIFPRQNVPIGSAAYSTYYSGGSGGPSTDAKRPGREADNPNAASAELKSGCSHRPAFKAFHNPLLVTAQ